jgi:excisionase family DNA binding protein
MKTDTIFREPEPQVFEPLAYRPREAAKALGISVSTLDRLVRAGAIPATRIGRVRVFEREVLAEFLGRRRETADCAQNKETAARLPSFDPR